MVSGQSELFPSDATATAAVKLPNAAEALMVALKQQQQSFCWCSLEPRTLLPSSSQLEQSFTECNTDGFNLMEEIGKNPDQVSWIGDPSSSPLALIHGPTGTFAVTKKVIIIGRDIIDSNIDLTYQETNFHSSSYMVLSYTGYPNRWAVQINGKNGVIINNKMYQHNTVPQYLPFSCVLRFPPSADKYFFRAIELPGCEGVSQLITAPPSNGLCTKDIVKSEGLTPQTLVSQCNLEQCQASSPSSSEEAGGGAPGPTQKTELSSVEESKDETQKSSEKPPYSYAQLIAQAIMSTADKQITLSGIYNFIMQKYPWYQTCDKGWQNSVRHNLSLSRYFVKTARAQNEPGKGSFWKMDSQHAQRNMEAAYEKKKPKSLKGCKSMNSSVSDLEDFFSEGHITPPLETSKTSDEDCIEIVDRQESSFSNNNEESTGFLHQMTSRDSVPPTAPAPAASLLAHHPEQATTTSLQSQMVIPRILNTSGKPVDGERMKEFLKLPEVPRSERFHELDGARLAELERYCDWSTRTAQSAPCSPKGILSRREQTNGGSTFRVRQSVKDGRSLLQICHSPPEFRSTPSHSRHLKTICSTSRNQILYQLRGGTKSLSTTPVRELLQGTSGLRFEDLKRDLPNLSGHLTTAATAGGIGGGSCAAVALSQIDRTTNSSDQQTTLIKVDDTIATTSFFARSNSDPTAPIFTMAQQQQQSDQQPNMPYGGKLKMSIYGKTGEHLDKLKSLSEVYEEIKGAPAGNMEPQVPVRVTRKYGMDGTIRPDIDKLLAASKRLTDVIVTSPADPMASQRIALKRKHSDDTPEDSAKRCHSNEMPPTAAELSMKAFLNSHFHRPGGISPNDDDVQVVHISEASTASHLTPQFAREPGLLPRLSHPALASPTVTVSAAKEYHKHAANKHECIAKPIPLGPSGPAVKQLLTSGKMDTAGSQAELAKRYEEVLLRTTPAGVCRESNITAGIPFPHLPSSSRIETQNPALYRAVAPSGVQTGLHLATSTPLPNTLVNSFPSTLQASLQAGIRPSVSQLQRGLLGASAVQSSSMHAGIFAAKPCVTVNVPSEALTKTLNTPTLAGKMFSPILPDVSFSLQNINRSQPTFVSPQTQPVLSAASQQQQNTLNLQLPSVMSNIRIPATLPIPTSMNPTSSLNPQSAIPTSSFANISDRNIGGVANLLQSPKQQADQLNLTREQINMSQEILEAKLKYDAFARLIAEQSAQLHKLLQQQQQQSQLAAALQGSATPDQLTNQGLNNALLSQCMSLNLLQQLKSPTTPNSLGSLMLPGSNPLALLTAQNPYNTPVTSRPDLAPNGVVNNGVCELIGLPGRNINNLLDARSVSSL